MHACISLDVSSPPAASAPLNQAPAGLGPPPGRLDVQRGRAGLVGPTRGQSGLKGSSGLTGSSGLKDRLRSKVL